MPKRTRTCLELIGRGLWVGRAGNYGHFLHMAYDGLPNVKMVSVSDPDPAGRSGAIKMTGAVRGYADYREMLE
jgi:predicted dehydrogenase